MIAVSCLQVTFAQSPPPTAAVREIIAAAVSAPTPAEQRALILSLKTKPTPEAVTWFDQWKGGSIFLYKDPAGVVTPVLLTGAAAADGSLATVKLTDNSPLLAADGTAIRINPKTVESAETDSGLRKAM